MRTRLLSRRVQLLHARIGLRSCGVRGIVHRNFPKSYVADAFSRRQSTPYIYTRKGPSSSLALAQSHSKHSGRIHTIPVPLGPYPGRPLSATACGVVRQVCVSLDRFVVWSCRSTKFVVYVCRSTRRVL